MSWGLAGPASPSCAAPFLPRRSRPRKRSFLGGGRVCRARGVWARHAQAGDSSVCRPPRCTPTGRASGPRTSRPRPTNKPTCTPADPHRPPVAGRRPPGHAPQVILAQESQWASLIRSLALDGTISEAAFMEALQRRMEGVVLGLQSGSYAQRVQAEFLKEVESRAKGVFRELAAAPGPAAGSSA